MYATERSSLLGDIDAILGEKGSREQQKHEKVIHYFIEIV